MEPLNFCRQMRTQFLATLKQNDIAPISRKLLSHCVDLAACSQKFIMPENGRLFDDPEYRGLDENEPLNLPYPFIALEYTRSAAAEVLEGEVACTKALVFAREQDDFIGIMPVVFSHRHNLWGPLPEVAISRTGYLDRTIQTESGGVPVKVHYSNGAKDVNLQFGDIQCEVGAVVSFLNAMACTNVAASRIQARKAKKVKGALPFDEYHVLTIKSKGSSVDLGGSHRSPREHLRRGHIRRLSDGRRLWINATVVNAGVGGVITKDYALQ